MDTKNDELKDTDYVVIQFPFNPPRFSDVCDKEVILVYSEFSQHARVFAYGTMKDFNNLDFVCNIDRGGPGFLDVVTSKNEALERTKKRAQENKDFLVQIYGKHILSKFGYDSSIYELTSEELRAKLS